MSEMFDVISKEYKILRNGDGWTIVNMPNDKAHLEAYDWCYNNIEVGDWTQSITTNHVQQFWFRNESEATMFILKWVKHEMAEQEE